MKMTLKVLLIVVTCLLAACGKQPDPKVQAQATAKAIVQELELAEMKRSYESEIAKGQQFLESDKRKLQDDIESGAKAPVELDETRAAIRLDEKMIAEAKAKLVAIKTNH